MIRSLTVALGLLAASSAGAAPPAWVVSDADSTVYLVGTVHMLPDTADWWSEGFESAFAGIDRLWLEVDLLNPPADLLTMMLRQAGLPEWRLSALLDEEAEAALDAVLARHGLSVRSVDPLQPWYVYMQLSSLMI